MSTEAEVSDAMSKPVEQNAQAADDAAKMLEELSGSATTNGATTEKPAAEKETTNGASEHKEATSEKKDEDKRSRSPEYRRRDRDDRGRGRGRGGGRGRGRGDFQHNRNHRNNIKSDLTTQEESDDPVAIRKQVCIRAIATPGFADQFRLNSISQTLTSLVTSSCLSKLVVARTTQSSSRFCTRSSACDTSNPLKLLSML
jgi:hypothetical protein